MLKKLMLPALLALATGTVHGQKFDREFLEFNNVHIPSKLIYDQVKTYGYNISVTSGDPSQLGPGDVEHMAYKFNSFNPAMYSQADMKINLAMGPFSWVGEKTVSRTVEEEVNKVKTRYTLYKRVVEFRYPMSAEAINAKNNVKLYHNIHPGNDVRSVETSEYRSEGEAASAMEKGRNEYLKNHLREHIGAFLKGVNGSLADQYDFYPHTSSLNIFQFKKWEKDDEYNAHVKHVKQVMKLMTAGEPAALYADKLKADIAYFKSFEGQFKPDDKKEDILYWGNYMNLATLYFCIDDLDNANYYLAKQDSSTKEKSYVAGLRNYINSAKARMGKHLLTTTHLDYNPAKDFRLAGKNFTSDALSAAENTMNALGKDGIAAASDEVRLTNGKTMKGKVIWFAESSTLKLLPAEKPEEPIVLNPDNTAYFTMDTAKFVSAKYKMSGPVAKQFFKVSYQSEKILLLSLLNPALQETATYGTIRPAEDLVNIVGGFGIKNALAKYFEDCATVAKKAKDGGYGSAMSVDVKKYMEMCADYSACQ